MEILLSNNQNILVNEDIIITAAEDTLRHEGTPDNVELSIALVDEEEMQRLNYTFRGKNTPTDVLSFETADETDLGDIPFLIGDVVICPAVALKQSVEYENSFEDELRLLTVHGVLHLLGYNHETDTEAEVMESLEQSLLANTSGAYASDQDDNNE